MVVNNCWLIVSIPLLTVGITLKPFRLPWLTPLHHSPTEASRLVMVARQWLVIATPVQLRVRHQPGRWMSATDMGTQGDANDKARDVKDAEWQLIWLFVLQKAAGKSCGLSAMDRQLFSHSKAKPSKQHDAQPINRSMGA